MEELFNNMIANVWNSGLSEMYENPLSYELIEESVGRACDFFHIEHPESIEPGHTTAVSLGDTGTYGDEILFFNSLQLKDMGIIGQDGLDLVMTHEGTHIALQDLDTGFNCYQEELCCDYMAGVRAGLNGIDPTQLKNSLIELPQGLEHPVGTLRVDAVEQGIAFAHDYMLTHDLPPTFNECLEDFKSDYMHDMAHLARLNSEAYAEECAMEHYRRLVDNEPSNKSAQEQFQMSEARHHYAMWEYDRWHALSGRDDGETLGSIGKDEGDIKEYVHKPVDGQYNPVFKGNLWTKSEIDSHKSHAKQEMDYQQSMISHYSKAVADRAGAGQPHSLESHQLNVAKDKYNAAKADYNKWCNEKPHEGTHRMLQGMEHLEFNSHQEELCCDYMAGVCAGLNDMDVSQMENSLMYTPESESHPSGVDRVEAIEAGVRFAQQHYAEYNMAPTFDECLDNFCEAHNMESAEAIAQTTEGSLSAPEQGTYNVSFQGKNVTVEQAGGGLLKKNVEICKKEGTSNVYEVKLKGSGKVVDVINSIRPGTIVEINGIEYKIP